MKIFNRLVCYVNDNLAELIDITELCAKLDVLVSFYKHSRDFQVHKTDEYPQERAENCQRSASAGGTDKRIRSEHNNHLRARR
jgi:hypothetical protein